MNAAARRREEVINVHLALLLCEGGVDANAETIINDGKARPDVLFYLRGLRVMIEGKYEDVPSAKNIVLNDAKKRLENGIAQMSVAVIYPETNLRDIETREIANELKKARLIYCILTELTENEQWFEGNYSELLTSLRRVQQDLADNDFIERTARSLHEKLDVVALQWNGNSRDSLSHILGIPIGKNENLEQERLRRSTAAHIAALILSNALIFQQQLSKTNPKIKPIERFFSENSESNPCTEITKYWNYIWNEINYIPIFQLAEQAIIEYPADNAANNAIKILAEEVINICNKRAALRHDLMGRIYHWLLNTAKYIGAYFTSSPAATLLLKLSFTENWDINFSDPKQLEQFNVVDLACGTGTLLMAASQALTDEYIRARISHGGTTPHDLNELHHVLMESILRGYDILPTAVHLTASTLAMLAPEVTFKKMNLFVMPMGVENDQARLGSLDFIDKINLQGQGEVFTQMALDRSEMVTIQTSIGEKKIVKANLPKIDLCVMNPPFVRSSGLVNLLFGSMPADQRKIMQRELSERIKIMSASSIAGLGSVFMALADQYLKPGGKLAFILPLALASGEAWRENRKMLALKYHLEMVITSHDPNRQNFSENTDLSEVMFVARKLRLRENPGDTKFVNLWVNPLSTHEALHLALAICRLENIASIDGNNITEVISLQKVKQAEIMALPPTVGDQNWLGALFSQTDLLRCAWHLERGFLHLPELKNKISLKLCRLDALGKLGPDRRRLQDGFKLSTYNWTPYAGFWGHDSKTVTTMQQKPNTYLRPWQDSPRGPDYGAHLWKRAGNILLAERMRTNTQKIIAARFSGDLLGNVWWEFKPKNLTLNQEKALTLWLNSSFGVLSYYSHRVVTHLAWVQMKQPAWQAMPVLDVRALSEGQLTALAAAYDELCTEPLLPLAQLHFDVNRARIDDALCAALDLPSIKSIREMLGREPGLTGGERSDEIPQDDDEDDADE
ncbi:MAG: N-6 DNA methylase [Candidatus Symbiobacter sp.]|nr:N-6 DNA methylase [Candidatus Symbiobacter sp.]